MVFFKILVKIEPWIYILSEDSRLEMTERESIDGASIALVICTTFLDSFLGKLFGSSLRTLKVVLKNSFQECLTLNIL